MVLLLTHLMTWLQPEATNALSPASGGGGAAGPAQGQPSSFMPMAMMVIMFVVLYFFMIRPQQKRQKELDSMLKALRKGDKVRTSGGIRGEIVDLSDAEITLLIADKVKINVLRSHVASKIDKPSAAESKAKDS